MKQKRQMHKEEGDRENKVKCVTIPSILHLFDPGDILVVGHQNPLATFLGYYDSTGVSFDSTFFFFFWVPIYS